MGLARSFYVNAASNAGSYTLPTMSEFQVQSTDPEITPQDFAQMRNLPKRQASGSSDLAPDPPILLDVREPWEFETAKLTDSLLMPMGDVPVRAHQELDPEEHVVVFCHSGVRSMNVTVWLRNQGFELVQSMRGGIDAWSREVDAAVPRY